MANSMLNLEKRVEDLLDALISGVAQSYFGMKAGITLYGTCSVWWGDDPDIPEDLKQVKVEYCFVTTRSQSVDFYFNIVGLDTKKYRLVELEVLMNGESQKPTSSIYNITLSDTGEVKTYKYKCQYGKRCEIEYDEETGTVIATKIKVEVRLVVEEPEYDEDGNEIGKKVWGGSTENPNDPNSGIPDYSFGDEGNVDEGNVHSPYDDPEMWGLLLHDVYKALETHPYVYIWTTNPDDFDGEFKSRVDEWGMARMTAEWPGAPLSVIPDTNNHLYKFNTIIPNALKTGDTSNVRFVFNNGDFLHPRVTPVLKFSEFPMDAECPTVINVYPNDVELSTDEINDPNNVILTKCYSPYIFELLIKYCPNLERLGNVIKKKGCVC